MKILFIAPANSIHTVRWINTLSKKGNKVLLVSLLSHREQVNTICKNVNVSYLKFGGRKGYYLNAPYLNQLYKKFQPDIINVHYASGYGTLARITRLPHILLSVWGSDVYDFPYESKWKMNVIRKNLQYAEKIASTSHAMARQVSKLIGNAEVMITPFGVDTKKFKRMHLQKEDCFTVGIIKALTYKYGVDIVIKAFYRFLEETKIDNARLLIYGDGEQKKELIKLCKKLNISEKVYFEGYIPNEDVPNILNDIDVICLGSRLDSESFGVSAVEAMACEVPVIATDVDGFLEVIQDNITGYIVPRNDYKSMASRLLLLYKNKNLRKTMGSESRKRVVELYHWDNNVESMIQIYKSISKSKQNMVN